MEESLPLAVKLTQPYAFRDEYYNFKPTVTLLKFNDDE